MANFFGVRPDDNAVMETRSGGQMPPDGTLNYVLPSNEDYRTVLDDRTYPGGEPKWTYTGGSRDAVTGTLAQRGDTRPVMRVTPNEVLVPVGTNQSVTFYLVDDTGAVINQDVDIYVQVDQNLLLLSFKRGEVTVDINTTRPYSLSFDSLERVDVNGDSLGTYALENPVDIRIVATALGG